MLGAETSKGEAARERAAFQPSRYARMAQQHPVFNRSIA